LEKREKIRTESIFKNTNDVNLDDKNCNQIGPSKFTAEDE
jgi:hypothetical protein